MTIDGTNINEYGMMLSYVDGILDSPVRKKVLSDPGFEEKDIVFENNELTITIFGKYVSRSVLLTNVQALYAKLKSTPAHDYILIGHNVSFSGVITEKIKSEVFGTLVRLTIKVTITT